MPRRELRRYLNSVSSIPPSYRSMWSTRMWRTWRTNTTWTSPMSILDLSCCKLECHTIHFGTMCMVSQLQPEIVRKYKSNIELNWIGLDWIDYLGKCKGESRVHSCSFLSVKHCSFNVDDWLHHLRVLDSNEQNSRIHWTHCIE